jgi:hypothetical protein
MRSHNPAQSVTCHAARKPIASATRFMRQSKESRYACEIYPERFNASRQDGSSVFFLVSRNETHQKPFG